MTAVIIHNFTEGRLHNRVTVIYLIGLMLTVLKPISETFCRLNSNVAFQGILLIFPMIIFLTLKYSMSCFRGTSKP